MGLRAASQPDRRGQQPRFEQPKECPHGRTDRAAPSPSSARTLAEALWFPVALFLGFLFSFAPALHAPQPHHVKVVVADPAIERRIDSQLQRQYPGAFDVTAVTDGRAARQAVLDRDAAAGFAADSRHPVLYVAKANGMSLELVLRNVFTEVATRSHQQLKVDDVAPTANKDLLGSTLVYFGIAWSVPGYILATTLLRAVTFSRRRKLLTIAGAAALFSVVGNLIGAGLGYIPAAPSAMAISFLLTMAVAVSSGLAPFARRFFPAVGMGLFIVLSIPTSGGVAPASMLPTFFQHVHAVMPLVNAVDALRGVLYFDGAGVLKPVLMLCAWITAGVALLGLDAWLRNRRAAGRYTEGEEEAEEPRWRTRRWRCRHPPRSPSTVTTSASRYRRWSATGAYHDQRTRGVRRDRTPRGVPPHCGLVRRPEPAGPSEAVAIRCGRPCGLRVAQPRSKRVASSTLGTVR